MSNSFRLSSILLLSIFLGCDNNTQLLNSDNHKDTSVQVSSNDTLSPKEMLVKSYQLFKEGDDVQSEHLANTVLQFGRKTQNDTLIGRALTSLCRNAQRKLDTNKLADLSDQLKLLSENTGNKSWLMYRAHMNAEMWRLVGNMERAEQFYNESLELSSLLGVKGMYTIDHFNKSFVSIAKGDYVTAKKLIKKYYQLRKEEEPEIEDAYGLIAIAYLLEQQGNYKGAYEVSIVTRRLFKQQNLFPEPPDEKPLLMVEEIVEQKLNNDEMKALNEQSLNFNVSDLVVKYLQ
ncbi:MAG: hypothetical protein JXR60_03125 [Bacteroidales bacterium]|nr:hypothetical protein [Bacteroidales bacterium]